MYLRRLLVHILMLLMLTPAMVCLMPCCPDKAAAAAPAEKPCHEMAAAEDIPAPAGPESPTVPMLGQDCLKNDLGAASVTADMPVPQGALFPALALLFIPALAVALPRPVGAPHRGADPPPGRHPSFHRLLLTLRLRP